MRPLHVIWPWNMSSQKANLAGPEVKEENSRAAEWSIVVITQGEFHSIILELVSKCGEID